MPFLSTLSLRRATYGTLIYSNGKAYFYPRSPCGERRPAHGCIGSADNISIHALLAESDVLFPPFFCFAAISIHALLAESDTYAPEYRPETEISIHALLAESDVRAAHTRTLTLKFLSTLSLRRATLRQIDRKPNGKISIHALLAESDDGLRLPYHQGGNFYPRSPCGERLCIDLGVTGVTINFYPRSPCGERRRSFRALTDAHWYFYPRSPCGERRCDGRPQSGWTDISIHALLAESDVQRGPWPHQGGHFYPRSPCGERPAGNKAGAESFKFLSTLSLRRATQCRTFANGMYGFLSTLSLRRATYGWSWYDDFTEFLSTLSLRRATPRWETQRSK